MLAAPGGLWALVANASLRHVYYNSHTQSSRNNGRDGRKVGCVLYAWQVRLHVYGF